MQYRLLIAMYMMVNVYIKVDNLNNTDNHYVPSPAAGSQCQCDASVDWEFSQLDGNHDGHVTWPELATIRENAYEPCVGSFLTRCMGRGKHGRSRYITREAWCCCFSSIRTHCIMKYAELYPTLIVESHSNTVGKVMYK